MRVAMTYRPISVLLAVAVIALFQTVAQAEAPKEIKTEKNKAVIIGNFFNAAFSCSTNPGPVPLPLLREKPSHGVVGLQIVAVTDACSARKIPAIALFYTPSKDFVGTDSLNIEIETSDAKTTDLSFSITVQEAK
jgi:hypothetical protein